eukprot:3430781-Rhodomonas_salina.1
MVYGAMRCPVLPWGRIVPAADAVLRWCMVRRAIRYLLRDVRRCRTQLGYGATSYPVLMWCMVLAADAVLRCYSSTRYPVLMWCMERAV